MKWMSHAVNFTGHAGASDTAHSRLEEPIRAELFSAERLEQHAESLAAAQPVSEDSSSGIKLAPRIEENGRILLDAYHAIAESVREKAAITPAAEWLLDNFHIVEEQLRDIHDHLPPGFYKELPKLAAGPLRGFPRVFGMSWAFVAHTDSRFDPELLTRFVCAYQRVQPLMIGELWAVAITLRSILIENLRRLSVRIVSSQLARREADQVADELLGLSGAPSQTALHALKSNSLHTAFAVQLVQRLRYQDPAVTPALQWLNERLAEQGTGTDAIVQIEHNNQAAANITVRNIITSMRLISAFDWQTFFEDVSLVDKTLHADAGFAAMDFITRDRYRHAIEDLAKGARRPELDIAHAVLAKTAQVRSDAPASRQPIEARLTDPGYYLISGGRRGFEQEVGFSVPLANRLLRAYFAHADLAFIGTILVMTLALLALPLYLSAEAGVGALGLAVLALCGFFPASDIAVALFNRAVVKALGPRHLPRLALEEGIAPELRTMVVVPTLLINEAGIDEQIEELEVHHLANSENEVCFALLSDWVDADTETLPNDDHLLSRAVQGIAELNARHGLNDVDARFFIFHRNRQWNAGEGKWIAWERKRGKLQELNRLLRGATDTSFLAIDGQIPHAPDNVRYVVTLDADTRLPRGAVAQLVGTMAHPLNRPRFDPETRQVVEGYGLLQPRITPSLPFRRDNSLFRRLFSGPCGLDPYAAAISDVYQDVFGEGSFTGKGIYEVDAFETALAGRVPDNSLLSHDLLEGIFARCGLVSDIEFIEDFPSHTEVAAARAHRWARGDWQLLPWLFGAAGKGITPIGRWKMLDNLRRTLSAPGLLFTLLASWLIAAAPQGLWAVFALSALAIPALLPFVTNLIPHRIDITARSYLRSLANDFMLGCGHIVIQLTLLAHQARLMLDAIARVLMRLFVTRRHLLEWVTAAQAQARSRLMLASFFWQLRDSLLIAAASAALVFYFNPAAWPVATLFIVLWAVAPAVAWYISLPPAADRIEPLTERETRLLRSTGRRIWRFFTTFVTAEDHALPPDNFQEDPQPVIAHRSSPTNFGLYLLSVVAARDFGWIGLHETVERLEATLTSLQNLPRYRGHFYNWYETRELRALDPKYISSVDSGNLAGHLLALAQAAEELTERPIASTASSDGLRDTLFLLREAVLKATDSSPGAIPGLGRLADALDELEPWLASGPIQHWDTLEAQAAGLADSARTLAAERGDRDSNEILEWAILLHGDINSHARDEHELIPQTQLFASGHGAATTLRPPTSALTLRQLHRHCLTAPQDADTRLADALQYSAHASADLIQRLEEIARVSRQLFQEMDFSFLFDATRKLFTIGYRVDECQLDASYYDLLASEARLTSFIAIAKGDIPPAHWFHLGRALIPVEDSAALVSWSGSMFEYLMPSLVMFTPRGSLLEQTCRLVIKQQIHYGKLNHVPWGISESAYNIRDMALTYQYSNFGIPGLGLKRGLSQDLVIAPYATALAAIYDPNAAVANLTRLEAEGGRGPYGFYEALDYTPERLPNKQRVAVVRAYMAHHQGMSLLALVNVLYSNVMRHRFHAEPRVQATELLLQERTPRDVAVAQPRAEQVEISPSEDATPLILQRFHSPHLAVPATHLLSNGRYAVMVTAAGSGYSRWREFAVTRWRPDATRDDWGSYIFLRDTTSGQVWSATYQPTGVRPDHYEAVFAEDRVRIIRRDVGITATLEILLSPEDDAEIRHLTLTNNGGRVREIEVTSYAEIVLAPQAADVSHPAFSNLFIETEYLPEVTGLIARRRPRSGHDAALCAAQVVAVQGEAVGGIEYETDRARFLGRGHTIHDPVAIMDGRPLSNTVGPVLDPIVSLRVRVRIAPGASARLLFATLAAASREEIVDLADKYHDPATFERISTLAWTQAQVQLHYLGITRDEAYLFQRLANRVLYSDPTLRPSSEILQRNTLTVAGLWPHRISGDLPIILVRIDDADDQSVIRQLLRAHEYWRMKRLAVDLVVLNEKASSYAQDLQIALEAMVRAGQATSGHYSHEPHGGIYILRADLLTRQERELLQTVARAILSSRDGSLTEQVMRPRRVAPRSTYSPPLSSRLGSAAQALPTPPLEFFNGLGGFADDGREYVIVLDKRQRTPAPWINVIANPHFGFQVSESGAGYTWSLNSRENQLTPWSNDPVSDPSGEAFYLRDEETMELWSPSAVPIRIEEASYIARHGQGYSAFEHLSHGIHSELLQWVDKDDPVKISRLRLENRTPQVRSLSVTGYVEWVLGFSRTTTAPYIFTEIDAETGALLACNPLNIEFGGRVGFIDMAGRQTAWSGDRGEFIGRNGNLARPAGLAQHNVLSRKTGAGVDPCGVLQSYVELAPGEHVEIVFFLGQAESRAAARELIKRYRATNVSATITAVTDQWDAILGKVRVRTPDRAMDILLNRWLLYQTLVCRYWARAAFYQAGGAYGFRDQLQDVMALTVTQPQLARAHILRAAARQFIEGDVQHWWHPPTGRGVRTHFSDDLVWLPYVVSYYIEITQDRGVLDEEIPFLEGPPLPPEREDAYFEPLISGQRASLFEHCARALEKSLTAGAHGLPLMGGGDWNDGMNRVGHEGKGESVWLGWFLHDTMTQFAALAELRDAADYVTRWRQYADTLQAALEAEAWDGAWYRRAYFDDGTPLGAAANIECRIDSIAQSWAVLSGAARPERARQAMESVERHLLRPGDGMLMLFTPPFDKTPLDPGYIKGYLPGIRENGGQYTHAALWCVMAYAALGDGARAGELFGLLNPINHSNTRAGVHTYKVEPYVIAADVYAVPPHTGRGGWTWYTGSAGWMYRAGMESILGLRLRGENLSFEPCIPPDWNGYTVYYRHGASLYEIEIANPNGVARGVTQIELDGHVLPATERAITLIDDSKVHRVKLTLG